MNLGYRIQDEKCVWGRRMRGCHLGYRIQDEKCVWEKDAGMPPGYRTQDEKYMWVRRVKNRCAKTE